MRHLLITTAIALCLIPLGASASSDDARARTLDTLRDLDTDLTSLTKSHLAYEAKAKELAEAARKLNAAVEQSLKIAGGKKAERELVLHGDQQHHEDQARHGEEFDFQHSLNLTLGFRSVRGSRPGSQR